MEYDDVMQHLKDGHFLHMRGKRFVHPQYPVVEMSHVGGLGGDFRTVALECVSDGKCTSYKIPAAVHFSPSEIKVTRYEPGKSALIKCVYANPQMNRTFAVLEDGTECEYVLSVLDLPCITGWSCKGMMKEGEDCEQTGVSGT